MPENFRHWNGNEENGNKKRASRMTKIKGNTESFKAEAELHPHPPTYISFQLI